MSSSRLISLCLCAVYALLICALGAPVEAARKPKPEFQIKFATLAPDGSTWMKTMRVIDDEVRLRTENRLGFKFYPGGVQGDEKDVLSLYDRTYRLLLRGSGLNDAQLLEPLADPRVEAGEDSVHRDFLSGGGFKAYPGATRFTQPFFFHERL